MGSPKRLSPLGSKGLYVGFIQNKLISLGYNILPDKIDKFGLATDKALKRFQRDHILYPNGFLDDRTLQLLNQMQLFSKYPHMPNQNEFSEPWGNSSLPSISTLIPSQPAHGFWGLNSDPWSSSPIVFPPQPPRFSPNDLNLSDQELEVMLIHELGVNRPKKYDDIIHPSVTSGVTIGPGFDLGTQSPKTIRSVLEKADLKPLQSTKTFSPLAKTTEEIIQVLITASSKDFGGIGTGQECDKFVDKYKGKLFMQLSTDQHKAILRGYIGTYESIIRREVHIDLTQYEYDALVSFIVNPGTHSAPTHKNPKNRQSNSVPIFKSLNDNLIGDALNYWLNSSKYAPSDIQGGIAMRRKAEVNLFLWGDYQ